AIGPMAEDDRATRAAQKRGGKDEEIDGGVGGGTQARRLEIFRYRCECQDWQVDIKEIHREADTAGDRCTLRYCCFTRHASGQDASARLEQCLSQCIYVTIS